LDQKYGYSNVTTPRVRQYYIKLNVVYIFLVCNPTITLESHNNNKMWGLILFAVCVASQPAFSPSAAFDLCQADVACSKLYGLGTGGTYASFELHLQIYGIPASPDSLLASFLAASNSSRKDALMLAEVTKRAAFLPTCPYDMVLALDPVTGVGTCVCPMGVVCRPACTDTDTWVWATVAIGLVLVVLFALKYMMFGLDNTVKNYQK
jgi:hypothetical protein